MDETTNIPAPLLQVSDAAGLLQVSDQHVRTLLRDGLLTGVRIGRVWAVDTASAEELAATRQPTAVAPTASPVTTPSGSMQVLSFFSGAMGLDLGLEAAGLTTTLTCEFDKRCQETIQRNRPDLPVLGNILDFSAAEIKAHAGLDAGSDVDVVVGGPPCQAFSTAGHRRGLDDERGNVLLRYVELIGELMPRYAVLENVRGLLSAPLKHRPHEQRGEGFEDLVPDELPGGVLGVILEMLRSYGYDVSFNLYNAANYGSPQVRERVVLVCSREGGRVPFLDPTHSNDESFGLLPWTTFREATADLPDTHSHLEFPEKRLKYYRMLGPGQHWRHLPEELQREALGNSYFSGGGKTGFLRRLHWDKPSPTLVTHPAMPATDLSHPEELRPLSVEEYKRIQDFPDDWELAGNLVAQYKQVGNAVPAKLGQAIGRALVRHSEGERWVEPEGFPYSRYRRTNDQTWRDPISSGDLPGWSVPSETSQGS